MGGFPPVRLRFAGERSGRSANGLSWPEGDRPLYAIGTLQRTFSGSIRPVANLNWQNSTPGSSILGGGPEYPARRRVVGNYS
jgi:hypothetical protein